MICVKEELANYSCIAEETPSSNASLDINVIESSNNAILGNSLEKHEIEEVDSEDGTTARGVSGSSLNSYPTGRTSKRRKTVSSLNNKTITMKSSKKTVKKGFADKPMHGECEKVNDDEDRVSWHKVYLKGLQMRRNIVHGNFEGWRIYANSQVPVTKLSPDLDFNTDVKQVLQCSLSKKESYFKIYGTYSYFTNVYIV